MVRLQWGERPPMFEAGVDQGVLYLPDSVAVWNGLISVGEELVDASTENHYYDGQLVHISESIGSFRARISAYTYPDSLDEDVLGRHFGLSYRTQVGNAYRIHLIYNAQINTDARVWSTIGNAPDPSLFAWNVDTASIPVPGAAPASHLVLEAPVGTDVLEQAEDILYGSASSSPRLPDPQELIDLYEGPLMLHITNNQDGIWTASGPDDIVTLLPNGVFEINAPSAYLLDPDVFTVSSQ